VRKARSIHGSMESVFAIKSIYKQKIGCNYENLRREIEIIKTLDHPHIIELHETFEDDKYIHIVMEYCKRGDLYEYLLKNSLTEA
jgi:serine/threonine protein kinase